VVVAQDVRNMSNAKFFGGSKCDVDLEPEEGDGSRDNVVKILES
jgi:hypothetical protein